MLSNDFRFALEQSNYSLMVETLNQLEERLTYYTEEATGDDRIVNSRRMRQLFQSLIRSMNRDYRAPSLDQDDADYARELLEDLSAAIEDVYGPRLAEPATEDDDDFLGNYTAQPKPGVEEFGGSSEDVTLVEIVNMLSSYAEKDVVRLLEQRYLPGMESVKKAQAQADRLGGFLARACAMLQANGIHIPDDIKEFFWDEHREQAMEQHNALVAHLEKVAHGGRKAEERLAELRKPTQLPQGKVMRRIVTYRSK